MNMHRTFVASLISVGLMSGAAMAADLPMPAPVYKAPPPPVYNWTGCYIGGGGGYGMWGQDSYVNNAAGVQISGNTTNGGKGWFGQGQAGCDYQFTAPIFNVNAVIGAFGDYDFTNLRGTSSVPLGVGTETQSNAWSAGLRAGWLVNPRFLTYFDGGYTQARFNQVDYSTYALPAGPTGFSLAAQTYNGWFLGSGFEYALDILPISGLFLKTEYRFSSYNSNNGVNVPFISTATGAPLGTTLNSVKYTQMISTELVWRFNWFGH
jgi:outer membrane immunogenic protein